MWDTDDFYQFQTSGGELGPGGSATATACRYASLGPRGVFYARIGAPSPDLVVTHTFTWATGSVTSPPATPIRDGNRWSYRPCLRGPSMPDVPMSTIPDSNGGQAVPMLITITVANPTDRRVSKIGGFLSSDNRDAPLWCPSGFAQF